MSDVQRRPAIGLAPLFGDGDASSRMGDVVYERLVASIRSGRLSPGDPFRDRDIASSLGVSRTPVREAMQRLERAGLLDVWPGRQTRVRAVAPADAARLHAYFGEICGAHVRCLLGNDALDPRARRELAEAAHGVASADDAEWGEAFTTLMERVSEPERALWGRMFADHLPLLSLVLRTLPEPHGDRAALSAALHRSITGGDGAEAQALIRALFGVQG